MENFLKPYQNILVLGSATALILRIVCASVKAERKKYMIYLSEAIYGQLEPEERDKSICFGSQRFDIEQQANQIDTLQKDRKFDCVLMPYGRDDQNWENVYEVAKEFGVPVFLVLKSGEMKRL